MQAGQVLCSRGLRAHSSCLRAHNHYGIARSTQRAKRLAKETEQCCRPCCSCLRDPPPAHKPRPGPRRVHARSTTHLTGKIKCRLRLARVLSQPTTHLQPRLCQRGCRASALAPIASKAARGQNRMRLRSRLRPLLTQWLLRWRGGPCARNVARKTPTHFRVEL